MVRITARDNLRGRGETKATGALTGAGSRGIPTPGGAIRVAHLSDLQLGTSPWDAEDDAMKARMDSLNPDVLLVVGDVADNGAASEYTIYGSHMASYKARTLPIPGNHDYTPGNINAWFSYFGSGTLAHGASTSAPWFSYDLANGWHIVGIAAAAGQSGSPSVAAGSTQYNWLAADLAANESKPTLVFWHEPRWSVDSGLYAHGDSTVVSAIWDLCVAHKVDIVTNGHVHSAQRFPRANANSTLNPLAPMEFIGDADYNERGVAGSSALTPSFASGDQAIIVFSLDTDSFSWEFVRVPDGAVIDSGFAAVLETGSTPPPSGAFRFFADTSLWNTVKTGMSFAAGADSVLRGASYDVNNGDFDHEVFFSSAGDPTWTFRLNAGWDWPGVTVTAKAPAGMVCSVGSDHVLSVLLTQGGTVSPAPNHEGFNSTTLPPNTLLDMWNVSVSGTTVNGLSGAYGLHPGLTGTGWGNQAGNYAAGTTASGAPQAAGTILASDIAAGQIRHALCMALDPGIEGHGIAGTDWVPPAVYSDSPGTGPIPQGGLLLIPPGTTKPSGLSTMGSALWDACATYGVYIIDRTGTGVPPMFYGDGSSGMPSGTDCTTVGRALRLAVTW